MRQRTLALLCLSSAAAGAALPAHQFHTPAHQFHTPAHGQLYRISASPFSQGRTFSEIQIERTAPSALAPPVPIAPVRLPVPLTALTDPIIEIPEQARLYFGAIDARGLGRLFELDLTARQLREAPPPPLGGTPLAVRALATHDGRRLYVQWLGIGPARETQIYDAHLLQWVGGTREFAADTRAVGFEHAASYLWTFDFDDRLVLVDTNADRVVRTFDLRGGSAAERRSVADAWHDRILVRIDAGHDRFRVLDIVSGETGPALDLPGYRRHAAHLVLEGRLLALVYAEHRGFDRRLARDLYVATGAGAVWDLRSGRRVDQFQLALPPDYPVHGVGVRTGPATAGRLWIFGAGDRQSLDLDVPACGARAPVGGSVRARLQVTWGGLAGDGGMDAGAPEAADARTYEYTLRLQPDSPDPAWALALAAGHRDREAVAPGGWGVDRIGDDRWVRWTNGLGPPAEDVAPGRALAGFRLRAEPGARPGIVEYRVQAATGLPRGCEPDEDFLENTAGGHTIGPERLEDGDADARAARLVRLVEETCRLDWLGPGDCRELRALATDIAAGTDRRPALDRFGERLGRARADPATAAMLADAAAAVTESLGALRR